MFLVFLKKGYPFIWYVYNRFSLVIVILMQVISSRILHHMPAKRGLQELCYMYYIYKQLHIDTFNFNEFISLHKGTE